MKMKPMIRMAAIGIDTPMPALAPVDKPLSDELFVVAGDEVGVDVELVLDVIIEPTIVEELRLLNCVVVIVVAVVVAIGRGPSKNRTCIAVT